MQPVFNEALLARLAQRSREREGPECSGLQILVERDLARLVPDMADPRTTQTPDAAIDRSAGESDMGFPITGDDPNDNIDPNDALPAGRWAELVSGTDQDPVSAEDARAVFHCIRQRLARPDTARNLLQRPESDPLARLTASEGRQDSGQPTSSATVQAGDAEPGKPWNSEVDFISTVGALHQAIEERYGEAGWSALVALWHTTAGIEPPTNITNRTLEQKVTHSLPLTPSPESEARALQKLPSVLRRFWLYEPRVPPCRHQETAGEREWRADREADGAWCG
jgi:hypothetical protein